ncbi:hypothetical protein CFIMG_007981RA00001 [Ceratocystis fimbriata CBS 114723]|uniref:Uncharacterized protein n=1 Tax=Ceratocystis fimbriata CBS 114723 TaxID=1035309 RepID=A0A2C5XB26_9PEZI|nr:hypothetical protein CFIMG_007981RA00001 [Ceratocystis fimbriata CBS 114723]
MSASDSQSMSRPSSAMASPRVMRSRTQSFSSDRPSAYSASSLSIMFPPLQISPEAAFIAESAASQIITNDHDTHADTWYDQNGVEPSSEPAIVTPGALKLVNTFLDQLLFNFLHRARGTSLSALRPAVAEVLKPKLAKDAINLADEELREYLGGGSEEGLSGEESSNTNSDWDQELVWKRTRLRCMVYSSLGDLEEEDEDFFLEQDGLDVCDEGNEVVSPAVAIFLTSILEFMGEQALVIAGQASYQRVCAKFEKNLRDGTRKHNDTADRISVEELDMERVALDRTLGRLWRAWKKRIRTPANESPREPRDAFKGNHARHASNSLSEPAVVEEGNPRPEIEVVPPEVAILSPERVPLPITDNDVNEIEVPGLVSYSEDEKSVSDDLLSTSAAILRPKSFMMLPSSKRLSFFTPVLFADDVSLEPRKRSYSLPSPEPVPFAFVGTDNVEFVGPDQVQIREPVVNSVKEEAPEAAETQLSSEPAISREEPLSSLDSQADWPQASLPASPVSSKRRSRVLQSPLVIQTSIPVTHRTRIDHKEITLEDDELDELEEEPEILTSARVSISTGSASPNLSDTTRGFNSQGVQRTNSVHSARIIEVTGPKSPVASRASSIDTLERVRTSSVSHTSSVSASPIMEEQEPSMACASPGPPPRNPERVTRNAPINKLAIYNNDSEQPRIKHTEILAPHIAAAMAQSPTIPQEYFRAPAQASSPLANSNSHHSPRVPQFMDASSSATPGPSKSPILGQAKIDDASLDRSYRPSAPALRSQTKITPIQEHPSPTSTSSFEDKIPPRPIHTSGSAGSATGSRLKLVRTSEESNLGKAEDMAKNFEELIQSDQTIQYTLTPEGMRDIDSPRSGSPAMPRTPRRANTAGELTFSRSESNSPEPPRKASVSSAHTAQPNPLLSHPIQPQTSAPPIIPVKATAAPLVAKPRGMNTMARDARAKRDSTMDFADFIRSTGPPGGDNPPMRPNAAVGRSSSMRTTNSASARLYTSGSIDASKRHRLMARDAAVDSRENNADLIDFIRRGPPSSMGGGAIAATPRPGVSAIVTPRTKLMDSDSELRKSQGSARGTDVSVNSSVTSQSALLKRSAGYSNGTFFDSGDMPIPQRKTRRVRDPYAIDFSDEEDFMDEVESSAPEPRAKPVPAREESLADFLRNYEPPPAQPVVPLSVNAARTPVAPPKKKSSMPGLIGRFSRNNSNQNTSTPNINANESRSLNSRSGSVMTSHSGRGYIPIQVNMPPGYDKYGLVDTSSNASTARQSRPSQSSAHSFTSAGRRPSAASTGYSMTADNNSSGIAPPRRTPMKRYEPREPVHISRATGTSELAAFLRSSEPPPGMMNSRTFSPVPPPEPEASSHRRMFSRRKKSVLA